MISQFVIAAGCLFGLSLHAAAQCISAPHPDGVTGPVLVTDHGPVLLEPAFEDYAFMLEEACAAWGFQTDGKCAIFPLMGDVNFNALATICDGNPVIVYDRRLSPIIGSDGAQAAIAHELGHLACGHLQGNGKLGSRDIELEADAFAGATLKKLGYDLEASLSYTPLTSDRASHSHPAKAERIEAITRGWTDPAIVAHCFN